jgi:hypothetical protein
MTRPTLPRSKRDIPTNNGKINRAALKRGINKRGKWGLCR